MIEARGGGIAELDSSEIPSSTIFPIETMKRYMPINSYIGIDGVWRMESRGYVWDIGSGAGAKVEELTSERFVTTGLDINLSAINEIKDRGLFAELSDVRIFADQMYMRLIVWLEQIDAIHSQALGPSLLGNDWKKVYKSADVALRPGGYVFIADFLRSDQVYPELFMQGRSEDECVINAKRWRERIEANWSAFGDIEIEGKKFSFGTVAVAKPGRSKHRYDWSNDPIVLRRLYENKLQRSEGPVFERFAQNIDPEELEKFLLEDLGYVMRERQVVEWESRAGYGEWYPGALWVFQKPDVFRYHPWKFGLRDSDLDYWKTWKARKHSFPGYMHYRAYFQLLLVNLHRRNNEQPEIAKLADTMIVNEIETYAGLSGTGLV